MVSSILVRGVLVVRNTDGTNGHILLTDAVNVAGKDRGFIWLITYRK